MAQSAPSQARRGDSRRRDRKGPLAVPSMSVELTLQSLVTQRVYKRVYERLKADLYTLTVRTRTVDMDAAADAAEQLVGGMLDQLQKDLGDDIHRTDVLMEQGGITETGTYEAARTVNAAYTTPLAKRFLDLLQGVDTLVARLDALWLHGTIDTRNCKDRSYQWQRRLFKLANKVRERAHGGRTAMYRELERRGHSARPPSDDEAPKDPRSQRDDDIDAMLDGQAASKVSDPAEEPDGVAANDGTGDRTTNGSGTRTPSSEERAQVPGEAAAEGAQ